MKLKIENVDDLLLFAQFPKLWEAVKCALQMGLFERIGKQKLTLQEITQLLDCDVALCKPIIDALILCGCLEEQEAIIFNSTVSLKYLTNLYRQNITDLLLFNAMSDFTAESFLAKIKLPLSHEKSQNKLYMSAMDIGSRYIAKKIACTHLKDAKGALLDLGCGSGIFSISACQYNPELRAVCVDQEDKLLLLEENLNQLGEVKERISLLRGDVLSLNLEKDHFNYVIISNLLHFFSKKNILKILKYSYNWLKPDGIIILNDIFYDRQNLMSLLFSFEWLANNVDFVTQEECKSLLDLCGFKSCNLIAEKNALTTLIFARKL